jgi:sugar lactone lactonase YvrE
MHGAEVDRRRRLDVSTAVERFSDAVAYHGEGPVWIGGLRFVDMLAGDIVTLDGEGAVVERLHVGTVAGAFRPRRDGGLVVGVERGFALVDAHGRVDTLPEVWADPGVRMNDGATDPDGRFYCGSMAYDVTPGAGALYRLDPDGAVSVVLERVTISNGLAWTADGRTAYYVDSPTHRIDVFDYDAEAGLINRRPFVTVAEHDGLPDGLTVDREDGVWVAFFGGSAVRRFSAAGTLEEVLDLPVTQVTACTFGGDALNELYITTSRENLPDDEQPEAGSVFRARVGVAGLLPAPFAA